MQTGNRFGLPVWFCRIIKSGIVQKYLWLVIIHILGQTLYLRQ